MPPSRYKRPVYIELPRDMISAPVTPGRHDREEMRPGDQERARGGAERGNRNNKRSGKPIIIAGVELHRFGLQSALIRLLEMTGIPVAATLLGKSVIRENHPRYIGVYEGAMGRKRSANTWNPAIA